MHFIPSVCFFGATIIGATTGDDRKDRKYTANKRESLDMMKFSQRRVVDVKKTPLILRRCFDRYNTISLNRTCDHL